MSRKDRVKVSIIKEASILTEVTADQVCRFLFATIPREIPMSPSPSQDLQTVLPHEVKVPPSFLTTLHYPILHDASHSGSDFGLIVEIEYEWLCPVVIGMQIGATTVRIDASGPTNSNGTPAKCRVFKTHYSDQDGASIALAQATMIYLPKHLGSQDGPFGAKHALPIDNEVRSEVAFTPHLQNQDPLGKGAEFPEMSLGPLTNQQLDRWNALDLSKARSVPVVSPEPVAPRTDADDATRIAPQRRSDNGVMRFCYVAWTLTNWLGDKGKLRRLKILLEKRNHVGDVTRFTGVVTNRTSLGSSLILSVEVVGTNQLGVITTRAFAEWETDRASSQSTEQTAVKLPTLDARSVIRKPLRWIEETGPFPDVLEGHLAQATFAHANKAALICGNTVLTYREMDQASTLLANRLVELGVQPGHLVGVCVPRSIETVLIVLAVLKSGASYIGIDPDYPSGHLARILNQVSLAVCTQAVRNALPRVQTPVTFLELDTLTDLHGEFLRTSGGNRPEFAYQMFTSGSTGEPRRVGVTSRALLEYIQSLSDLQYCADDVCLHTASFSFSASVRQLFAPLLAGATLVIATSEEIRDPLSRFLLMGRHGVTLWDTTPSTLRQTIQFLETCGAIRAKSLLRASLHRILVTGEPLRWAVIYSLRKWIEKVRIFNLYSQTETAGTVCCYEIREGSSREEGLVPVGKPLPRVRVLILDSDLNESGDGETGEVYVSTSRLASGYIDADPASDGSFVSALEGRKDSGPWYRTKDSGILQDGILTVYGRVDAAINLRGVRFAPIEVELILSRHPIVKEVLAIGHFDDMSEQQLTVFVVAADSHFTTHEITQTLRRLLPSTMQPDQIKILTSFPRLVSGKIDRVSLRLQRDSRTDDTTSEEKISDEVEVALSRIWCAELGVPFVGRKESLYEAGGDSLNAVRIIASIEGEFNRRLPLHVLFAAPTIASVASFLKADKRTKPGAAVLHTAAGESRLFLVPGLGGHSFQFLRLANLLGGHREVYGLDYPAQTVFSVEEIALGMISDLLEVQPLGPYSLAGHSFGGRVAFEIAKQLRARGSDVFFLGFIDASGPIVRHRDRMRRILRQAWRKGVNLKKALRREGLVPLIRRKLGEARGIIPEQYKDDSAVHAATSAERNYLPAPYVGSATLFRTSDERSVPSLLDKGPYLGWRRLVRGELCVVPVSGDHDSMLREPHVASLAAALVEALNPRNH